MVNAPGSRFFAPWRGLLLETLNEEFDPGGELCTRFKDHEVRFLPQPSGIEVVGIGGA